MIPHSIVIPPSRPEQQTFPPDSKNAPRTRPVQALKNLCRSIVGIFVLWAFLASSLYATCITTSIDERKRSPFAIVIDAGSTGSRVYVYEVRGRVTEQGIDERFIVDQLAGTTKPGVSEAKEQSFASLAPLLSEAASLIPSNHHSTTPVYLLATAGMRYVEPVQAAAIYDSIATQYQRSSLPFYFPRFHIQTISGDDESYYGWIAVQYLLGTLPVDIHTRIRQTVAALDLGGSSAQVTFEPARPAGFNIGMRGVAGRVVEGRIFQRSFLGWGVQAMRAKVHAAVLREMRNATAVHPCLHWGYTMPAWPGGAQEQDHLGDAAVFGSGNVTACREMVASVMEINTQVCDGARCAIGGESIPVVHSPVLAMSAYFYVIHALHSFMPGYLPFPSPTVSHVDQASAALCGLAWDLVSSDLTSRDEFTDAASLPFRCLESTYILLLLRDAFHLQHVHITFASAVNETDVNWSLGAMLSLRASAPELLPAEIAACDLSFKHGVMLTGALAAVALCCNSRTCMAWRRSSLTGSDTDGLADGRRPAVTFGLAQSWSAWSGWEYQQGYQSVPVRDLEE